MQGVKAAAWFMDKRLSTELEESYALHGNKSPGTTIGVIMADYALDLYSKHVGGDERIMKAAVETKKCIADSVQTVTGCTAGGGLTVMDYGKYALTLYNKITGEGVRVFLDPKKIKEYQNLNDWFLRKKSKSELSKEVVIEDMLRAGRRVLSYERIQVTFPAKEKLPVRLCAECGEAFPSDGESVCRGCLEGYYEDGLV